MSKKNSLQALNYHFYQNIANSFSLSRQHDWPGFSPIKSYLFENMSVLDIACGNGRFISTLNSVIKDFHYTGFDLSESLIAEAKKMHPNSSLLSSSWEDWIENNKNQHYDLITCFGMLHHCSDLSQIKSLADYWYHSGSTIVISRWNCIMNESLMNRRLDFSSEIAQDLLKHYNLEKEEFTAFEFIFDWKRGSHAYRYVRYWTDDELIPVFQKCGLHVINTWIEDGKNKNENTYFVLRPTPGLIDIAKVEEQG